MPRRQSNARVSAAGESTWGIGVGASTASSYVNDYMGLVKKKLSLDPGDRDGHRAADEALGALHGQIHSNMGKDAAALLNGWRATTERAHQLESQGLTTPQLMAAHGKAVEQGKAAMKLLNKGISRGQGARMANTYEGRGRQSDSLTQKQEASGALRREQQSTINNAFSEVIAPHESKTAAKAAYDNRINRNVNRAMFSRPGDSQAGLPADAGGPATPEEHDASVARVKNKYQGGRYPGFQN